MPSFPFVFLSSGQGAWRAVFFLPAPPPHSRQIAALLSISKRPLSNGLPVGTGDRPVTTPADRLTTLEIRAAEQERTIEDLSGQVAEQWKTIDRMQKKLDVLAERFLALEEQAAPDVPVTKPPHW